MNFRRDTNPGRLRYRFEPGCNVDTIAIEIAALDHDIAQIDTDAQNNASILRQARTCCCHTLLQLHGALHCIHRATELDEHAIAHNFENAAAMTGNYRLQHILASRLESGERASLVVAHQPTVPNDVGGQYCGKPALDKVFDHSGSCPLEVWPDCMFNPSSSQLGRAARMALMGLRGQRPTAHPVPACDPRRMPLKTFHSRRCSRSLW